MGGVDREVFNKAVFWLLNYLETKYSKDDYRFHEVFAQIQGDEILDTFPIRCIAHAEELGCPHASVEECDKHKDSIETRILTGRKCQHCSMLEGYKEKWDMKLGK